MGVWVELSSVLYDIIEWEMCIYDLRQRDQGMQRELL